jgi:chorismate mutase/prephenate dehydratase
MPSEREQTSIHAYRQAIESIDQEMLGLFARRLQISHGIAALKACSGTPVLDSVREDELVALATSQIGRADVLRAESLLRGMMRLSRSVQYEDLLTSGVDFPLGDQLEQAARSIPAVCRIACQGTVGSYSELACRRLFPNVTQVKTATFAEACAQVRENTVDAAVLPLENSTAGTVDDVYDLLLSHSLCIWRSLAMPIIHRLLVLPGTRQSDIRQILSHPQALAQCSEVIRRHGWTVRETLNTAFAAETVARGSDTGLAALASADAAAANGLHILDLPVNNAQTNQTRFIVVGRSCLVTPDADRISLIIRVPHRSGALAATLSVFGDRGLNLCKVQSRPDPANPWVYLFYVDFECPGDERRQALATLYQLSCEMPFLRLLGWYREENVSS